MVTRVLKVVHDITQQPPVGVLHFVSREGGFRAVRFTDIEKIRGSLGATEARVTVAETVKEERANRRRSRRARRRRSAK